MFLQLRFAFENVYRREHYIKHGIECHYGACTGLFNGIRTTF